MTSEAERVKKDSSKLQRQLEDRRKSRAVVSNNINATVEGFEKRIQQLCQENDELEEEVGSWMLLLLL